MKSVPETGTAFVARDPCTWQGFPGMCLTPAGRLVIGIKQAYGHGASRWQRVVTMVSDDHGHTWTAPATVAEGDFDRELPFVATGGLYLTALRDGRVLMHYFTEDWPERKPTTPVIHVSDDAGITWSAPIRMTRDLEFRQDGAVLERRAGDLAVYSGLNRLVRSTDRGQTWEPYGDPVVPDDCPLQLAESCLAELADGRLIILMRENHYANFPMFAAVSEDAGRTWSRPRPTPFIGHWPAAFDWATGRTCWPTATSAAARAAWYGEATWARCPNTACRPAATGKTARRSRSPATGWCWTPGDGRARSCSSTSCRPTIRLRTWSSKRSSAAWPTPDRRAASACAEPAGCASSPTTSTWSTVPATAAYRSTAARGTATAWSFREGRCASRSTARRSCTTRRSTWRR